MEVQASRISSKVNEFMKSLENGADALKSLFD